MVLCQECGKEIANGASVCKHCHAVIGTPKRPLGITVIAILTLLSSASSMVAFFGLNRINSIILGLSVPVALARVVTLVIALLGIYCGIGFLKQRALARKIYIWIAIYGILNQIISPLVFMNYIKIPINMRGSMFGGMILGITISGWILFYLIRKKDYFTN